jgi:hypothetical protein
MVSRGILGWGLKTANSPRWPRIGIGVIDIKHLPFEEIEEDEGVFTAN